jgi:hypothetical protein
MPKPLKIPNVSKFESILVVLFIPSVDRNQQMIDQGSWAIAALEVLGKCFGGATAFPKGKGIWRDDQRGGVLIYDEPVIMHCYTNMQSVKLHQSELHSFLLRMGKETNQGAVGFVIDGTYMEIQFSLQ